MNDTIRDLIQYVAENDIAKAKIAAEIILKADTSAKNRYFCERMLNKLHATPSVMELPSNIRNYARMEDVSLSFREDRYFLSEREEKLFAEIERSVRVNGRLTEMGIRYLNASLLYGESGTGKTTFGRYVAYKLGVPFLYLNFAECISSYLGQTGHNIQQVLNFASTQKCVLMLDEIDAIGISRGKGQEVGEMARITISLMQGLDLLQNDVVLLGATNRFESIDPALIRRFTRRHEVTPLEESEVLQFSTSFLLSLGYDFSHGQIAAFAKAAPRKQSDLANYLTQRVIEMIEGEMQEEGKS